MFSFTDFKISLGIKNEQNDLSYANIMRGFIKELYTKYGICISKDTEDTIEDVTITLDTEISLTYKNIVSLSISGYTEGIDYIVDYEKGLITALSTGTITDGELLSISYMYYIFINESNEILYELYTNTDANTYFIDLNPYNINNVTYQGNTLVEDTDFYSYNGKFELVNQVDNIRKPIILNLQVGYTTVPEDLRMAFYEVVKIRHDRREAKADIISRVQDNNGSETTYRDKDIPKHLENIFYYYSGRRMVM